MKNRKSVLIEELHRAFEQVTKGVKVGIETEKALNNLKKELNEAIKTAEKYSDRKEIVEVMSDSKNIESLNCLSQVILFNTEQFENNKNKIFVVVEKIVLRFTAEIKTAEKKIQEINFQNTEEELAILNKLWDLI